ncbi:MAG: hypothetical protein NT091_01895 [Candidatus Falkowbacteria bacterium]|nr:hypothetical protein [Candidatus Falkowbacteria bacterium]
MNGAFFEKPKNKNREKTSGLMGAENSDLIKHLNQLSQEMSGEEQRKIIADVLSKLRESAQSQNFKWSEDVSQIYNKYKNKDLIIRREHVARIADLLEKHKDIAIDFDPTVGHAYANCTKWDGLSYDEAIRTAFLEGFSRMGGIASVVAFKNGKSLKLTDLDDKYKKVENISRRTIGSVHGIVPVSDIQFVIFQIPASLLKEDELTDDELDRVYLNKGKLVNVFRAIDLHPIN